MSFSEDLAQFGDQLTRLVDAGVAVKEAAAGEPPLVISTACEDRSGGYCNTKYQKRPRSAVCRSVPSTPASHEPGRISSPPRKRAVRN